MAEIAVESEHDPRFSIFSPNILRELGILLYRPDSNHVSGSVFFTLDEIPPDIDFITENKLRIRKNGLGLFSVDDKKDFSIEKLHEIGEQEEIKLKHEQKRLADLQKKEAQGVRSFEDLPNDIRELIIKSKIEVPLLKAPNNWEIMLNILRFCEKKDFRTFDIKQKQMYPQSKLDGDSPVVQQLIRQAESLIIVDDKAKKYFKSSEFTGKGGFGKVFFAVQTYPEKYQVAIKKMPHSTEKDRMSNYLEIGFLSACIHPNIVRYMSSYKIEEQIWIVTEFMSGGTLHDALQVFTFDESHVAFIAREILKAIEFLHYRDFMHRDIKSNNIMLTTDGAVKLIDFGLCDDVSTGPKQSMCGSYMWMSPEMIQHKPYSCPIDIWSFGMTLFRNYQRINQQRFQNAFDVQDSH